MLRRTIVPRFSPLPRAQRLNAGDHIRPNKRVFQRANPVHMYANKETSSLLKVNLEESKYTKERFWISVKRFWTDKHARYYFGVSIITIFLFWEWINYQRENQEQQEGLLGPKRKKYQSRLTVVLDVDETLISFGDRAFRLKGSVKPRPYLAELLDYLAKIDAEVVLWSAGSDRYMKAVLMAIDPAGLRVDHYLTREGPWFVQDLYYEKNLLWLKRPMEDVLFIENRPMSIRNCNKNSILVQDFIRGEFMDTGRDFPQNDKALKTVRDIVEDLEKSGKPVYQYLADKKNRNAEIKQIPCHIAMRQMPDELAVGDFYFVGDRYKPTKVAEREIANGVMKSIH